MKQNRQPIDIEVPIKIDWIICPTKCVGLYGGLSNFILNRMTLYSQIDSEVFVTS